MTTAVSNRLDALFARCRAERRAALIIYLTSGFPNAAVTARLLPVLAEAGCDLLELGIPFSDPIADGPTIQRSSTIALENGMTMPGTLELLRNFRRGNDTMPVILFGALNPYLVRGLGESARLAAEAGADGVLAADMPIEEAGEFAPHLAANNLHLINLLAPTTPDGRVRQIAAASSGFIYCISLKGTTGARESVSEEAQAYLRRIRAQTELPLALGFGISRPEHVRLAVDCGADAVVVGSALINLIEKTLGEGGNLEATVRDYLRTLVDQLGRR